MGWVKMDGESSTLVSTYFSPLRSLVDIPFSCSISQDWFRLKLYWSVARSDKFIIPISAIDSDVMPLKQTMHMARVHTNSRPSNKLMQSQKRTRLVLVILILKLLSLKTLRERVIKYQVKYKTAYCTRTTHQLRYAWTNWMRRYCYWRLPLDLSVH